MTDTLSNLPTHISQLDLERSKHLSSLHLRLGADLPELWQEVGCSLLVEARRMKDKGNGGWRVAGYKPEARTNDFVAPIFGPVAFLTGSPARNLHGRPFLYFIFLHR
jgi:hypothetical protein